MSPAAHRQHPSARALIASVVTAAVFVGAGGVALAAGSFKPSSQTIVLNKAIAGVKISQKAANAKKAWHVKLKCSGSGGNGYCSWTDTKANGEAKATLDYSANKVNSVVLYAGQIANPNGGGGLGYLYKGALTKLKTNRGLGLGSSFADVHSKAAGGEIAYWGNGTSPMYYIVKSGKVTTTFSFSDTDERANSIQISNQNSHA